MGFSTLRLVLILAIISVLISGPSSAIKITSGTGRASVTGEYSLQNSAFLDTDITLGQGAVSRLSSAGGNGKNTISECVSGSSGSITNTVSSGGSFRSASVDFASGEGAASTYQASLAGSSGSISTASTGKENEMFVAGGFLGDGGALDANLVSAAGKRSRISGEGKIGGVECLNNEILQEIGSIDTNSVGAGINGLYLAEDGYVGDFGFTALNINKKSTGSTSNMDNLVSADTKADGTISQLTGSGNHPELGYAAGGNALNYIYPREAYGSPTTRNPYWEINTISPVKYYLRTDSKLTSEGLNSVAVKQSLTDATQTWDSWTSRQLFDSIGSTTRYSTDRYDRNNVIGWKSGGKDSWLAYNQIYFKSGTNNKWILQESDIVFNSNWGWTTSWDTANAQTWTYGNDFSLANTQGYKLDLQAVALHELGHSVGLGDLYMLDGTTDPRDDGPEIMNYYYLNSKTHHNLGLGDVTGLRSIYGS